MEIEIEFRHEPIADKIQPPPSAGARGAWLEFRGVVRDEENGQSISALEYETYPEMAEREIRRILESLAAKHPCLAVKMIHRIGVVPVGDTAIYVGVASAHRSEGIALLAEFMDRLKQDVPIWKRRPIPLTRSRPGGTTLSPSDGGRAGVRGSVLSLDEARAEIRSRCQMLPAVRVPLAEAFGRVLRETVAAPSDLPDCDRATRDGYAVLQNDNSETFQIVDTVHAADWKPRQLKAGQAVRIATGAPLPCGNVRVMMQENVERNGDRIKVLKRDSALHLRKRGEDVKAGTPLVTAGARLDAGALSLLATAGCAHPLVSPRLRVVHFTTGDEIIPPDQTPKPGQVRDSNSILIRGLLQRFPCDLTQRHLPEDFEAAKAKVLECGDTSPLSSTRSRLGGTSSQPVSPKSDEDGSADMSAHSTFEVRNADLILISGGASVGDKDFTRALLEWLGFEIVFSQVNVRPGRPLIFGINGGAPVLRSSTATEGGSVPASRLVGSLAPPNTISITFGLPGNPLSHFVCFHMFVATALASLVGEDPPAFLRGRLAARLEDVPCPRETLWPAHFQEGQAACLTPLAWASSGDVTCLTQTNALIRVPANRGSIEAGAEVDFLPTNC